MLTPSTCSLSDIQTVQTPTVEKLVYVLSTVLPRHIATPPANPSSKPLKLVIIDALAELFHTSVKTTTQTLVERSRRIFHISMLLHWLASRHRIAILVLNEVTDVFACDEPPDCSAISYRDQARWFNRAGNIPEEGKKEAALGLAWANQVNARIFLTRTGRRRYLDNEHDEPTVIRRLSVVFSSVSPPASCDYIVTSKGISVIPHSITLSTTPHQALVRSPCVSDSRTSDCSNVAGKVEQSPLDGDELASAAEVPAIEDEYDDEWESFWEANSLPDDVFTQT
ncbi:hypothetical protein ID866_4153 [Astraeus odoratus]|nr:hypothetical protein ID866_4153 [Astraeus odoratus]